MTKCKDCAACTPPNRSGFSVCKEFESPYYGFAVVEQSFGCKYGTDFGIGKRKRKNGKERKEPQTKRKTEINRSGN
ncbi:hypothetical protein FACS1894214_2010 [Planctomycetales bacterium]|nr:hypothetical protein FACS1894214_2010 [Planctomycetales bacterium]